MKAQPNYQILIPQIINEEYSDFKDLGQIKEFIPKSCRTSDFELSEGYVMRVQEEKQGIYYNVFRNK